MEGVAAESAWLPPRDAWLVDPKTDKIETPVDGRGLIDVDQLISDVKDTIDPAYIWGGRLSVHHLYWPESAYPYQNFEDQPYTPKNFRNLPIHKALVPRIFENWLHMVTVPSEVPTEEVMIYRLEAWNVAKELFRATRATVVHEKIARRRRDFVAAHPEVLKEEFGGEDVIGEDYLKSELERHFRDVTYHQQRHRRVPIEHRLISAEGTHESLASSLGKLVGPPNLQLVRAVNQ